MTGAEAALRVTMLILGVGLAVFIGWIESRDGEGMGCLALLLGLVALTLIIGGVAGSDAARALWA